MFATGIRHDSPYRDCWCAKVHTVTALFARLQLHKARCPMIVEIRTDSRRSWCRHMLKSFKIDESCPILPMFKSCLVSAARHAAWYQFAHNLHIVCLLVGFPWRMTLWFAVRYLRSICQSSRLGMQNVRLSEVQFLIFDTPDNKCKLLEQEKAVPPFVKLSAYTIIGTT